ncbi:MAG TPA: AAA family ATPase [Armatimonadota bacterium]
MILLRRLRARNFKQLADLHIRFPEQGAILIEGDNEAGKSSLFEAVFFALYGRTLLSDQDYTLSELRRYSTEELTVELELTVDGRDFLIERRVGAVHTCRLVCPAAEGEEPETLRSLTAVRQRLLEETGLSAEALLNTCFVEQKRLERLEDLNPSQRQAAINELLNLKAFTALEAAFRESREEVAQVQVLRARADLARQDSRIPALEDEADQARRCLSYALLLGLEREGDEAAARLQELSASLADLAGRRDEVEASLGRCAILRRGITAVEGELSHRCQAWQAALEAQGRATAEAGALQELVDSLPGREAAMLEGEELCRALSEVEGVEARLMRVREAHAGTQARLERLEQPRAALASGLAERENLESRRLAARQDQGEAEEAVLQRSEERGRAARLRHLLSLIGGFEDLPGQDQGLVAWVAEARRRAEEAPELLKRRELLAGMVEREERSRRLLERRGALAEELTQAAGAEERGRQGLAAAEEAHARAAGLARSAGRGVGLSLAVTVLGGVALSVLLALRKPELSAGGGALLVLGLVLLLRARSSASGLRAEERVALERLAAAKAEAEHARDRCQALREDDEQLSSQLEALGAPGAGEVDLRGESPQEAIAGLDRELASAEAMSREIPRLEVEWQQRDRQSQRMLEEIRRTAGLDALVSDTPAGLRVEAEEWLADFERRADATPDAALQARLDEVREDALALERKIAGLDADLAQWRRELSVEPAIQQELQALEGEEQALLQALDGAEEVRARLEVMSLPGQSPVLRARLDLLAQELASDRNRALGLDPALARLAAAGESAAEAREGLRRSWAEVLASEPPDGPGAARDRLPVEGERLRAALAEEDEPALQERRRQLTEEAGRLGIEEQQWRARASQLSREREARLGELGCAPGASGPELAERHPELASVASRGVEDWRREMEERRSLLESARAERRVRASALGLDESPLDLPREEAALTAAERERRVKALSLEMLRATRQRIVKAIMPLTLRNTRQMLPLLTEGRYQDVEWDEVNNVISVYDSRAKRHQRKRVFSGGARDQISLALRLAFALATLPGEMNVRPGWLFLDEPLSSFDRRRTQALVELITSGLVGRQFRQVLLVSHSDSVDPSRFTHRLRLEAGAVVESTLPEA